MAEFKGHPLGILVSMEQDPLSGFIYNIWFPYSRSNIKETQEGNLVVVKNFASSGSCNRYCILELVSVLPVHYALGSSPSDIERAFPGFVVEAAKSARMDWEQETPVEQTTKIKAQAIPTGLELVFENGKHSISGEKGMPMIGEDVYLLSDTTMNEVINKDLLTASIPTIEPCRLVHNDAINVRISLEDLLRTHFGIFGFTGSGKSNLLSTLISSIFDNQNMKVVLFDLMIEYSGLLIDLLSSIEDAYIIALDEDSLPGGVATSNYLLHDGPVEEAAEAIVRTLLLPKQLAPYRRRYKAVFREILEAGKVKLFNAGGAELTYGEVYQQLVKQIGGSLGNCKGPLERWTRQLDQGNQRITIKSLSNFDAELQRFIDQNEMPLAFEEANLDSQRTLDGRHMRNVETVPLNNTAISVIYGLKSELRSFIRSQEQGDMPETVLMSFHEIREILNEEERNALFLFQSNRDDNLRSVSANVITRIYGDRRYRGIISPQVLFAFDEADEFMPRESGETYAESRWAIATLARRGRKFGLGLTFATQRVAYLDTSILAQPHTYLISKLTREYDRKTVSDSFGLTEDILRRTLKFSTGEWLLVSYDATGLSNVPLPVRFPDANLRIIQFLEKTS